MHIATTIILLELHENIVGAENDYNCDCIFLSMYSISTELTLSYGERKRRRLFSFEELIVRRRESHVACK